MDGERVDAGGEFIGKRLVNHAVAIEPALPPERLRYDIKPEMRFPARPVPCMPGVLTGFVNDRKAFRCESLGQLLRDDIVG
jgi:hypothetical protein